jgi:hypothetical protein
MADGCCGARRNRRPARSVRMAATQTLPECKRHWYASLAIRRTGLSSGRYRCGDFPFIRHRNVCEFRDWIKRHRNIRKAVREDAHAYPMIHIGDLDSADRKPEQMFFSALKKRFSVISQEFSLRPPTMTGEPPDERGITASPLRRSVAKYSTPSASGIADHRAKSFYIAKKAPARAGAHRHHET